MIRQRRAISYAACAFLLAIAACSGDAAESTAPPQITAGAPAATCAIPGQLQCGGVCTDVQSDARNCGACAKSCGSGICTLGQCACPSTLTACGTGCVDTLNDPLNCGACARACGAGSTCQQGQCLPLTAVCTPACVGGQVCAQNVCKCPEQTTFCAGACVDTNTTPAHCGMCGAQCGPGQLCQAGKCACPAGQTMCGTECVDVQLSSTNCGMCGKACAMGESCMAGVCHAPLGADGCGGAPPRDIAIQEVAAFQTVKVSLSRGVTPIDPAMRVGLVQNKPTLFRVYVAPGSGFTAREFSARVTIKNGAGVDQYFAKQRVSKASTDADSASTFQIDIPREKIQADTTYSVELADCGGGATAPPSTTAPVTGAAGGPAPGGAAGRAAAGSGAPSTPAAVGARFPAQGETPLAALDTGTLRITVVPLVANGNMPDMSAAALKVYADYFEAMYPIDKIILTAGKPLNVTYPVNWNTTLEQLRAQRQRDMIATEEYYYGMLKPTKTFQEFCRSGCTAGVGYIGQVRQTATRVAMGLAYGDELAAGIMAHEVGHNHGRPHAPCAPGNQIQGVDSRYPYQRAATGIWGYDIRNKKFLDPMTTKDIMGYCDPKWISDYTYKALLERSSMINKPMFEIVDPELIQQYRVLLLDEEGPRWSIPFVRPEAPHGEPETADVLDVDNQPVDHVTVYRTQIGDSHGYSVLVPQPKAGWNSIKLHDALPLSFSAPVTVPEPE
ncbi:MAG TPA: M66 family metalloprotease [Polyangiales bacterium]|nr:M66 family metalloprotease [Polyangiales bacterium]